MTRKHTASADIVYLSMRDWLTVAAIIVPVACFIVLGYLRHDRALTTLLVQQINTAERIERIEARIEPGGVK